MEREIADIKKRASKDAVIDAQYVKDHHNMVEALEYLDSCTGNQNTRTTVARILKRRASGD